MGPIGLGSFGRFRLARDIGPISRIGSRILAKRAYGPAHLAYGVGIWLRLAGGSWTISGIRGFMRVPFAEGSGSFRRSRHDASATMTRSGSGRSPQSRVETRDGNKIIATAPRFDRETPQDSIDREPPPEQVRGDKTEMGPTTDIYSLGVVLQELMTGRRPFEGPCQQNAFMGVPRGAQQPLGRLGSPPRANDEPNPYASPVDVRSGALLLAVR
jgi:hypothetical protein